MTTKELIKKLENKSAFRFAWAILWRNWVLILGAYLALFLGAVIIGFIIGILGTML